MTSPFPPPSFSPQVKDAAAKGRDGGADGPVTVHDDLGLDRAGAFVLIDIMIAKVCRWARGNGKCISSCW